MDQGQLSQRISKMPSQEQSPHIKEMCISKNQFTNEFCQECWFFFHFVYVLYTFLYVLRLYLYFLFVVLKISIKDFKKTKDKKRGCHIQRIKRITHGQHVSRCISRFQGPAGFLSNGPDLYMSRSLSSVHTSGPQDLVWPVEVLFLAYVFLPCLLWAIFLNCLNKCIQWVPEIFLGGWDPDITAITLLLGHGSSISGSAPSKYAMKKNPALFAYTEIHWRDQELY